MGKLCAVIPAIAGCLVTGIVAPADAVSAARGGFAVTRVIVGGGGEVMSVAADPVTGVVYAADSLPGSRDEVAAIDAATGKVAGTVSVPIFPRDLAVNTATDTVYAVGDSPAGEKVEVINGATATVTTTIALPPKSLPVAAAVNPATHRLYVADYANKSVDVINTTSDRLIKTITLDDRSISAVAVDAATNQIYVADDSNSTVTVISGATNLIKHRIALPYGAAPRGIAVGSGVLYVADAGTNAISVIDTATDTVSATIAGVPGVADVALGPAGTLYAAAPGGGPFRLGVTYVIDAASGKVTALIPRGGGRVAVDAGSAYLSDGLGPPDSVSVVTPSSATTMCPVFLGPWAIWFTGGRVRHIQLKASAIPPASFSATGLPAGLTLSPSGSLSGNPAAGTGGLYQAMVTVANGISPPDTELLDIEVFQPPVITSPARATFRTGVAGVFDVTATGVPAPTFAETGPLPRGVTLHAGGVLEGLPAKGTGGRYPITLTASNGHGPPAKQAFTLTVNQRPAFTSPDRVTFRAGKRHRFTIVTRGFPAARLAKSGKLPRGITFRARHNGTATLTGKASRRARGHTFRITITARNGVGRAAHQVLTIVIR